MKSKKIFLVALLHFVCFIATAQPFVVKFDVTSFISNQLPEFRLIRNRIQWNYGREYIFGNESKEYLYLTVGIHSSAESAQKIAFEYLNDLTIKMYEDTTMNKNIGDISWLFPNSTTNITNIVLVRKNVLVILSSHKFRSSLLSFAKSIDNIINNSKEFVEIANKIHVPTIHPNVEYFYKLDKKEAVISFSDSSVTNNNLDYYFMPGISKVNNQYTIRSVEKFKQNLEDKKKIKAIAVNQYNVVSEITEFELK